MMPWQIPCTINPPHNSRTSFTCYPIPANKSNLTIMPSVYQRFVLANVTAKELDALGQAFAKKSKHWSGEGASMLGGSLERIVPTRKKLEGLVVPKYVRSMDLECKHSGFDRQAVDEALETVKRFLDADITGPEHMGFIGLGFHFVEMDPTAPLAGAYVHKAKFSWSEPKNAHGASMIPDYAIDHTTDLESCLNFGKKWACHGEGVIEVIARNEGQITYECRGSDPHTSRRTIGKSGSCPFIFTHNADTTKRLAKEFAQYVLDNPAQIRVEKLSINLFTSTLDAHNQADFLKQTRGFLPDGWQDYTMGMLYSVDGLEDLGFLRETLGAKKHAEVSLGEFEHPLDAPDEDVDCRGELKAIVTKTGYGAALDIFIPEAPRELLALFPRPPEEVLPGCVPGFSKGKAPKKKAAKKK